MHLRGTALDTELPNLSEPTRQDLEQAFGVFNELSERLTTAYGQLEARVALLSEELASSRRERLTERAEKEHLADQLGVLLEALPAAVVLVDMRDRVDRFNPAAEQLFPQLAWGRLWTEIKAEVVIAEPAPGDWQLRDGVREIPIEERDPKEVSHIHGVVNGKRTVVRTTAENTPVSNYAFDVTPARLVTGLITERGICEASEEGLLGLFPEMRDS